MGPNTEDLPPTVKGRNHEIRALALREFAGLRRDDDRLNPFKLARYAKLTVVRFSEIEHLLSEETKAELTESGKNAWSGGASSQRLPDGSKLIILNPTHGANRQNATLMEEISHVFLGHQPSRLAIAAVDRSGKPMARDYRPEVEEEAYGVGAAALVPYTALRRFVRRGETSRQIARHFAVSRDLVEFRLKVTKLWDEYKRSVFAV